MNDSLKNINIKFIFLKYKKGLKLSKGNYIIRGNLKHSKYAKYYFHSWA